MKILHAGIQRTGTNFISKFIYDNWKIIPVNSHEIERNLPLHKHFRIQDDKSSIIMDKKYKNDIHFSSYEEYLDYLNINDVQTILMYKNEAEWLESIKKWAFSCRWINNELEFEFVKNDYLNEYRKYYEKWNSFKSDKITLINHNNIMNDFDSEIEKLFKIFGKKDNLILPKYVNLSGKRDYKIKSKFL